MGRLLKLFVPKTCADFETDLVLYAYGKIDTEQTSAIETHLDACVSCRDHQDQLLKELATAPLDSPQPEFWEDYTREMRQKLAAVETREKIPSTWLRPFRVRGITAMAAGMVLVIALGISLQDRIFSSGDRPQDNAVMDVLPIVQNLEFFESMHFLEMMDREADGKIKSSQAGEPHGRMIVSIQDYDATAFMTKPSRLRHSVDPPVGQQSAIASPRTHQSIGPRLRRRLIT